MNYQQNHNPYNGEEKQTPRKDSEKRDDKKPTEKPNALHSEYMSALRTGY